LTERGRRWAEVDDLVQGILFEIVRELGARPPADAGELLRRVRRTTACRVKDAWRNQRNLMGESAVDLARTPEGSPSTGPITAEDRRRWLEELVGRLPEKYAAVVRLCGFEQLTCVEAAARLKLEPDTVRKRYEVARQALAAGATIINDISGLQFDPQMIDVCAASDCGVVCMHIQGTPQTMQADPRYDNVVTDVIQFFRDRLGALALDQVRELHALEEAVHRRVELFPEVVGETAALVAVTAGAGIGLAARGADRFIDRHDGVGNPRVLGAAGQQVAAAGAAHRLHQTRPPELGEELLEIRE